MRARSLITSSPVLLLLIGIHAAVGLSCGWAAFNSEEGSLRGLAPQGHQGVVGRLWAESNRERVDAYGFRFCSLDGTVLVATVSHAVRRTDTWADFGSGAVRLQLLRTCATGDIALYAEPDSQRFAGTCLSGSAPSGFSAQDAGLPSAPARVLGTDESMDSPALSMTYVSIEEWPVRALAFEISDDRALSGAPVVNSAGRLVGMVFGRLVGEPLTLATPEPAISDCARQLHQGSDEAAETRIAD